MKKLTLFVLIIVVALALTAFTPKDPSPTNYNSWDKAVENPILEESCSGFTAWVENSKNTEEVYNFDFVANGSQTVTLSISPIVEVGDYTVIMRTSGTDNTTTSEKYIVKTNVYNLVTGVEKDQAIKAALEKMDGIASVIFTFSAHSKFLNFGKLIVDTNSISCAPQILK